MVSPQTPSFPLMVRKIALLFRISKLPPSGMIPPIQLRLKGRGFMGTVGSPNVLT
jgi:hypothetical protein